MTPSALEMMVWLVLVSTSLKIKSFKKGLFQQLELESKKGITSLFKTKIMQNLKIDSLPVQSLVDIYMFTAEA